MQNFAKLHLLKGYVTIRRFDTVCLFETYLDLYTQSDDGNYEFSG